MRRSPSLPSHRPRELRRTVFLKARVRTPAGWGDACIVNVSSRGALIHAGLAAAAGSTIELRHQQHAITATVVWRDGARIGLRADERVPVEEILSLASGGGLQLTAGRRTGERRRAPRRHDVSRIRGRLFEFAGVAAIAGALAAGMAGTMSRTLARPIASVAAALGSSAQASAPVSAR